MSIDWQALRDAAAQAQARAYAPYSKFRVGAALLTDDGRIVSGCNVENASYGLCICAERNAVFAAVAAGAHGFQALAVISSADDPVTPCGACRQVLAEFRPSFEVRCYGQSQGEVRHSVDSLLPHAFSDTDLKP
ncbi:MAG TPA: cytidine deaminase [Polyangiales bacterium]|nr:cytidine deaminase [Polyangiales bacterium]